MFLSRCISVERSEDTLQRLLENVNRVPLHEDFHFRVTNGQRAEVKRVLHCDATARADMDAPPLLLREQCIDKERSEDTLPNLLRNINRSASARVFARSCYKLSTG